MPDWILRTNKFQAADFIWFMGIWKPSPASLEICKTHSGLQNELKKALHDFSNSDVLGSPYSIFEYFPNPIVSESFESLKKIKVKLEKLGKKLILDFVPNHMSVDSPLIDQYPELFLHKDNLEVCKNSFLHKNGKVYYHGKDPNYDGWTDTVQWDFSKPGVLSLHYQILSELAEACHGVRCDMAMLPCKDVFLRTHGKESLEYWKPLISSIKKKHPDFVFIGEVYWNKEYELQQEGFDYTYDKELYDRLQHNPGEIKSHLKADIDYQNHSVRFLENHDEPRAYPTFGYDSIYKFSLLNLLPGLILYHQGQDSGVEIKLPVQLGRAALEVQKKDIFEFYSRAFDQISKRKRLEIIRHTCNFTAYNYPDSDPMISYSIYYFTEKIINSGSLKIFNLEIMIYNPTNQRISGWLRVNDIVSNFLNDLFLVELVFYDLNYNKVYKKIKQEVVEKGIYIELDEGKAHWLIIDSDLFK